MPGFWTWAFWNSTLVTTIIGTLIFTGVIAIIATVLSHRLEKRRKIFDFKLDVFRTFHEKSVEFYDAFYNLIHISKLKGSAEFEVSLYDVRQRHLRWYLHSGTQIPTVFRNVELFTDLEAILHAGEAIFKTMKDPKGWSEDSIYPILDRYSRKIQVIMLRMRKEMQLITFDDYYRQMASLEQEELESGLSRADETSDVSPGEVSDG